MYVCGIGGGEIRGLERGDETIAGQDDAATLIGENR